MYILFEAIVKMSLNPCSNQFHTEELQLLEQAWDQEK